MLTTTGYTTGWTVENGIIGNEPHNSYLILTKTEADPYSATNPWLAPELGSYPVGISRSLSPPVSYLDFRKLIIKAYYTYSGRCTPINITLYSSTGSAKIETTLASQQTLELELGPTGGWTITGTMDWEAINQIKIETGCLILEQIYFEGESATLTSLSEAKRKFYDQKIYEDTVTFEHKSDMQTYASNLLEKLKNPQRSVSLRAKGFWSPPLYSTIKVTLAGEVLQPVVMGLEWDFRKGITTFTLENYTTNKLVSILSQMLKGK